jgi:hypothetical protein
LIPISSDGFKNHHGVQAIKNRPEQKFGRDHIVPGLFSELFNVAASRPAQMTTEPAKSSPKRADRQGKAMVNQDRTSTADRKTLNVFFAFSACSS